MFPLYFSFVGVIRILLVGLVILLLCKVILPLKQRRDASLSLAKGVKSPQKHWFFGHLLKFPATEDGLIRSAKRAYGYPAMSMMWFGPTEAALECYHPDTVKALLTRSIPKATFAYKFLRPWLGNSILLADGDVWKRKRKMVSPAFNSGALKSYMSAFNAVMDITLKKLKDDGRPQEIYEIVNLMTLDAVLRCCMSRRMDPQNKTSETLPFVESITSLNEMTIQRIMQFHLWNDRLFRHSRLGKRFYQACDVVHREAETTIQKRRHARNHQNGSVNGLPGEVCADFLDRLLDAKDDEGNALTDAEIRSEVDTFLFAGHDTTASAISWTLYCLAKYPQYQDKSAEELKERIANRDRIEWSDIKELPYTRQCIDESMRLYPPVTGVGRCPAAPLTISSRYDGNSPKIVPPNSNVNIRIFDLHRHPDIWEDPQTYNPERFSPENVEKRPACSFIPFSIGHRNCVGRRFATTLATVALARILLRYELYVDEDTPQAIMKPRVVLRPENGIFVKIRKRP